MEIKKDCFAYDTKHKYCDILKELYCRNEECKFYKNRAEVDKRKIEEDIKRYSELINNKGGLS